MAITWLVRSRLIRWPVRNRSWPSFIRSSTCWGVSVLWMSAGTSGPHTASDLRAHTCSGTPQAHLNIAGRCGLLLELPDQAHHVGVDEVRAAGVDQDVTAVAAPRSRPGTRPPGEEADLGGQLDPDDLGPGCFHRPAQRPAEVAAENERRRSPPARSGFRSSGRSGRSRRPWPRTAGTRYRPWLHICWNKAGLASLTPVTRRIAARQDEAGSGSGPRAGRA